MVMKRYDGVKNHLNQKGYAREEQAYCVIHVFLGACKSVNVSSGPIILSYTWWICFNVELGLSQERDLGPFFLLLLILLLLLLRMHTSSAMQYTCSRTRVLSAYRVWKK